MQRAKNIKTRTVRNEATYGVFLPHPRHENEGLKRHVADQVRVPRYMYSPIALCVSIGVLLLVYPFPPFRNACSLPPLCRTPFALYLDLLIFNCVNKENETTDGLRQTGMICSPRFISSMLDVTAEAGAPGGRIRQIPS